MSGSDMTMVNGEDTPKRAGWLGRMYQKSLESCRSPRAPWVLGVLSFTESCCFIIPPEFLMLPMSYANRKKAFWFATITTVTSVLGAIFGYFLGATLWENGLESFMFSYVPGFEKHFNSVGDMYRDNAAMALFLAAFTPIPFKVFTVAAGVYSAKVSLAIVIIMSIIGRGLRYFSMCALVYFFGERAQGWIEKHFKTFTIGVGILVVLFVIIKKLL